jgi:DNA-binding response OmpR family regulator
VRLLIVEDEVDLASALARGLRRRGHGVGVAATVRGAELAIASTGFDLLVIDWNLPDGAGIDICRRVANGTLSTVDGTRPKILLLTARDSIDDRVEGLDAGADDYLVKPFAFAELEARIRALLRRDTESPPILQAGDIELDPARFEVRRGGLPIELTAKEFSLLEYFVRHRGEVLSQERLLEHVWDEMVDPFTNTVRVTISNLRRKLGEPQPIETVPGRGYVLRG